MENYTDIFWGMVSAFVAFLLGLVWDRLTQLVVYYRARRFWRSLIAEDLSVVLGRFRDLPGFEASGLVGVGDNIALKSLTDYFSRIGFKRFGIYYNDAFNRSGIDETSPLRGNLILIGGPDSNRLTREVLRRVELGVEFLEVSQDYLDAARVRGRASTSPDPPARTTSAKRLRWFPLSRRAAPTEDGLRWRIPVFLDQGSDRLHGPLVVGLELSSDCGFFMRCPNPFNPERQVMVFCGSYGYGTWAAVQFAQSKEFLSLLPKRGQFMECLIEVDVVHEAPQNPQLKFLRPLTDGAVQATAGVSVPRLVE